METLYALNKKGKIQQWKIDVVEENGVSYIVETYGLVGKKLQTHKKAIIKGKNIGKKNETTPFEQANLIANSKYQKKIRQGYGTNKNPTSIKLPMLVKIYNDEKNKVHFPAYIQPKLNGVRGMVLNPNNVEFISRGNKKYETIDFLKKDIETLEIPTDGEIFNYGLGFQDIVRLVKKERDGETQLNYWIYDIPNQHKTFEERFEILRNLFEMKGRKESLDLLNGETIEIYRVGNTYLTPTYIINNEDELEEFHRRFVSWGFEGSIIRNANGLYLFTYRSDDIFKKKDFKDDEFEIIDFTKEINQEKELIMFVCKVNEKETVTVRPKGTLEEREEMYKHGKDYIGKKMTIKFQDYTESGNLVFPVGVTIRDYE